MAVKPPFTDLQIPRAQSGFYAGYSLPIATVSKFLMVLLVLWALTMPDLARDTLSAWNFGLLEVFNAFYIMVVGLFIFFLFIVAAIPNSGRRVLGTPGEKPEFSTFSWFAMMLGAGLGVGLMVFAIAEPVGLWNSNPEVVAGTVPGGTEEALQSTFRYTFLHFGWHAWGVYVITGLSLAYYAFTRGMPLTVRTALTPILGRAANGWLGHVVDILAVIATILGVSVTIGYGVAQFVDGLYAITGMSWLVRGEAEAPTPTTVGLIAGLLVIMGLSILSAVSGVGRGIKYLSNLNLVLSFLLLATFVVFGSFLFALTTYGTALVDYVLSFFALSFEAYSPLSQEAFVASLPPEVAALPPSDLAALYSGATNAWGSQSGFAEDLPAGFLALDGAQALIPAVYDAGDQGRLFGWQAGWTTFYWAWWIAFAPFVGVFLARISRGRTVREFVLGAVIAPALVCFAWMTILGGTAVDLEVTGAAGGAIVEASNTAKLFVTLGAILDGPLLFAVTVMCVVLIMTFLVTSADSGILVMNTIMAGGDIETGILHRIIWGVILTLVIASLLIAGGGTEGGGLRALQYAMVIGALPFTFVMVGMVGALATALFNDSRRDRAADAPAAQPAE
ncbi:MAG: BCCT family transporter [Shimia sp.]